MSFVTVSRNRAKNFVQTVLARDAAEIAAQEAEIQRRVKQEVAKLRDAALAEAKTEGEEAIRAEMAPQQEKLIQALAVLENSIAQLAAPLAHKEEELAGLVLDMAFLLARHIAGGESGNAKAELARLVKTLLQEAAKERGPRQSMRLHLNPSDLSTLKGQLAEETLALVPDDSIAQGGALLELLTEEGDRLDKAEWDAKLENRFTTIHAALALPGKDTA
jgi:flagellar biosynthesis/type III secretory pathway protein FliH